MPEENKPQVPKQTSSGADPVFVACPKCGLRLSPNIAKCPQDGTEIPKRVVSEFAEKYEILDEIGTGGMSVIYKARQRALGRIVAIKMLHSHMLNVPAIRRFQHEAKAVSLLHHANIVAVHDFGLTDEGRPYMVMDFVDGKTLSQVLDQIGEMPVDQSVIVFMQICDALNYAHLKGILHRDLKPSNIMITHSNDAPLVAKLVDFGIAKMADDDGGQKLTQTGELFGSPLYMSPEQCLGKVLDKRSDIYSFGCLMHECLTGQPPHIGETVVETMSKRIHDKAPLLSQLRKDKQYPAKLEDIVDKTLNKNPDSRYQTMQELKNDLEVLQQELDSGAQFKTHSTPKLIVRRVAHNRKLHVTIVSIMVATLAVAGGFKLMQMRNLQIAQEREREEQNEAIRKAELLPSMDHKKITVKMLADCLRYDVVQKELDLSDSPVNDVGLEYVANQSNLQRLNLKDVKHITDEGLKNIKGLRRLQYLNLSSTPITDDGLRYLEGMTELKELLLRKTNGVFGNGLKYLAKLPDLHILNLEKSAISGNCLAPLKSTPLEQLYLNETHVKDDTIAGLENFEHLKELQVCIETITDKCATSISTIASLERLGLAAPKITDNAAPEIAKLSKLKFLDISWTKITKTGLAALAKLPELNELSVEGCKLDDQAIEELTKFPKLTTLYISKGKLTEKSRDAFAKLHVEQIFFADLDEGCIDILAKIKTLRRIHVKNGKLDEEDKKKFYQALMYCKVSDWK